MSQDDSQSLEAIVLSLAKAAREASYVLSTLSSERKNAVLEKMAILCLERKPEIQAANAIDLENGEKAGLSQALLDRLKLHDERIDGMVEGLRQVASLPDPVGEEIERLNPPAGLDIRKVRVPIGVIGIIYESRPNVTIDCAALCIKSGNASILRGGKEAFYSNQVLAKIISDALELEGVDRNGVVFIPTTDRKALNILLKLDEYVHCIIPRGGERLIRFVTENSNIPVIKHFTGVCSVYVDEHADLEMAKSIVINGKCSRPAVCNAVENLFIHESIVEQALPMIASELVANGVELRVDESLLSILKAADISAKIATEEDFYEEYIDLILSIKTASSTQDAVKMINRYGSGHSDAIVTANEEHAMDFLNGVDGATVYWNASTRFTDGFEFGLGAEIGISTDRLHARGPMGLRELCTYKFLIFGKGEVR